jgi:hypothetical protein
MASDSHAGRILASGSALASTDYYSYLEQTARNRQDNQSVCVFEAEVTQSSYSSVPSNNV